MRMGFLKNVEEKKKITCDCPIYCPTKSLADLETTSPTLKKFKHFNTRPYNFAHVVFPENENFVRIYKQKSKN